MSRIKILFWQTSDWFNFNLAYSLQKLDYELYAIIDTVNKPKKFFEKQKFVNYKKTWFFHDYINIKNKADLNYLKDFESRNNINLWLLAYNERIFFNYNKFYKFSVNEVLAILEQECRLFESVLDEIKPNFLIISLTWQHQGELLRLLCKSKGIKVLMINPSDLGAGSSYWTISEDIDAIDYADKFFSNAKNTSFTDPQKFLDSVSTNKNLSTFKKYVLQNSKSRLSAGINVILSNNSNSQSHFTYFGRTKSKLIKYEIRSFVKSRWRKFFIDKNFTKNINYNEKFIFFPLHAEEERATLLGTPFYTNQVEVIKHIVKSLPIGYKLYVKEHPLMAARGWREISIYREIMNLPNVRLIHPDVNSLDLIKSCTLVITIFSTVGLEAAFYEKPSINFGKKGHSVLSSSFVVEKIDDLSNLIKKGLQTKVDPAELGSYLENLRSNLFKFDYNKFVIDYGSQFHYGGNLVDVIITNDKMREFLKRNEKIFDNLALEYKKKIEQHIDNGYKISNPNKQHSFH